ncbi:Gcd10p-like protein [Euroglyphus maynei]|uniref:tRNA (adenine(58)-N(1))-methyltransferase non-catalytic subunit TRM6 n=1 Tax=Euroglyphus maynei TaxID=6958 RepID=A0A1Y3AM41_EURMA|nr:Gcd10p-like protein [Euroglyphus maynei]
MDIQLADNDDNIIQSEHFVIMRKTFKANTCKLIKLGREKYFFFFKHKILTESLVGQKYGLTFELTSDKTLKSVNLIDYLDLINPNSNSNSNDDGNCQPKDNRFLVDNNSSQKLTRNDIEKIKKEKSGQQVIQTLVENSATFVEKNVFSQVKYLQKKQKKYVCLVTVTKPTAKLLMEMYYSQSPSKNK